MYHSVTFGNKNTWEDWRLIPASPPMVAIPPVRKNMVELPGGNGSVDLTQFIAGHTLYGVSEGTWEFIMSNQDLTTEHQKEEIVKQLHGKRFEKIILEDVPGWYYSGFIEVGDVKRGKTYSAISIKYTIDPYRHKIGSSSEARI